MKIYSSYIKEHAYLCQSSCEMCKLYVVLIGEGIVSVLACCMNRVRCLCCWLPLLFFSLIWLEISFLSSSSFIYSLCFFAFSSIHGDAARSHGCWFSFRPCWFWMQKGCTHVYGFVSHTAGHACTMWLSNEAQDKEFVVWRRTCWYEENGASMEYSFISVFTHSESHTAARLHHFLMMLNPSSIW